jgi:predicted  nucleic acid-binding Zn-ribbon protein
MEEYLEMLREAENGVRQSLRLDPENEKFWDELAELHPRLTTLEARSNSLQEEIEDLMAKLPED